MEAIILAGGLGTRLREVVQDLPKPMAPVAEKPFLEYLIRFLERQGVSRIVLSVGYKYEIIQDYFKDQYESAQLIYSIEDTPLGTGGAIAKALEYCENENVIVLNGDSFIDLNLSDLVKCHFNTNADITMALKKMTNFDRYGTVECLDGRVNKFNEKQYTQSGQINSGVYLIKKSVMNDIVESKFSFEKAILEAKIDTLNVQGLTFDSYFIDIGIPEDFERAQIEMKEFW